MKKCTVKEQETCAVEKLGCKGCFYNKQIKVGNLVRVKGSEGYIGKLIEINKNSYNYLTVDVGHSVRHDLYPESYLFLKNTDIAKYGENLGELLEEGDLVTYMCGHTKVRKFIDIYDLTEIKLNKYKIISVLTKKQIEQNMYKQEEI